MFIPEVIENVYEAHKSDDIWADSPFKRMKELTIDHRGKVGEQLVENALKSIDILPLVITETITDVNNKGDNVHYDLKLNNALIEIKTALKGSKNDSWQHENVYPSPICDISIFLDFDIQNLYISIVPNNLLPLGKDSILFGRKHGTVRQNHIDVFKLDFSRTTLNTLSNANHCRSFSADATAQEIGLYIKETLLTQCGNYF